MMNRIKRISTDLLLKHSDKFGPDFENNKKSLSQVAIVRSKVLRNELAGYITSHMRKQAARDKDIAAVEETEGDENLESVSEG